MITPAVAAFDLDPGGTGGGVIKNTMLGWKTCQWNVGSDTGRLSIWVDEVYLTYYISSGYTFTSYKVKIAFSWSGRITLDNAQFNLKWGGSYDYVGDAWYIGDGDFPSNGGAKTYTSSISYSSSSWTNPRLNIYAEGKSTINGAYVGHIDLSFKITPTHTTPWVNTYTDISSGGTVVSNYWDSFVTY